MTGSIVVALDSSDGVVDRLTDPDGLFGMPADAVDSVLVRDADALATRVDGWAQLGAERVVLTLAGDDWFRQAELAAEALLAPPRR